MRTGWFTAQGAGNSGQGTGAGSHTDTLAACCHLFPVPCALLAFALLAIPAAGAAKPSGDDTSPALSPALTPAEIEADWLRQAELRYASTASGKISPEEDAAGGNDGVKDGKNVGYYGFHTDQQENPWWQVDLAKKMPLAKAVIYNGSTIRPRAANAA